MKQNANAVWGNSEYQTSDKCDTEAASGSAYVLLSIGAIYLRCLELKLVELDVKFIDWRVLHLKKWPLLSQRIDVAIQHSNIINQSDVAF